MPPRYHRSPLKRWTRGAYLLGVCDVEESNGLYCTHFNAVLCVLTIKHAHYETTVLGWLSDPENDAAAPDTHVLNASNRFRVFVGVTSI